MSLLMLNTGADGNVLLPARARTATGEPRFHLPIPPRYVGQDLGIQFLIQHEAWLGGYEPQVRGFFDAHLRPGDVFIDVGAHWGFFSLSAATRWPGQVQVLAIEPDPRNVVQPMESVRHNGLEQDVFGRVRDALADAAGRREPIPR